MNPGVEDLDIGRVSRRPNPNYSLAGPKPELSDSKDYNEGEDLGYENGQKSRPQPQYGLIKSFPSSNRNRWSKKSTRKIKLAKGCPKQTQHGSIEEPSDTGKPQGQVS